MLSLALLHLFLNTNNTSRTWNNENLKLFVHVGSLTTNHQNDEVIISGAMDGFKNTKSTLEKLLNHPKGIPKWRHERYKAMLKVTITNSVNLVSLKARRLHKSPATKVLRILSQLMFSPNSILHCIQATLE